MTTIAALNIHGGGTASRVDALVVRMLGYGADVLVVPEFKANDSGERLEGTLRNAGYTTSHPDAGPKRNSVLIASRRVIERSWAFSDHLDACRLGVRRDRRNVPDSVIVVRRYEERDFGEYRTRV